MKDEGRPRAEAPQKEGRALMTDLSWQPGRRHCRWSYALFSAGSGKVAPGFGCWIAGNLVTCPGPPQ